MAGSWQPEEGCLRQILQLLKEAQSPDNSKQREVFQVSKLAGILIIGWFYFVLPQLYFQSRYPPNLVS